MSAKPTLPPACELNVTPMLDVLLVLLIIFMAISIQIRHSVDVQLPQTCTGACAGADQIVLEVLPGRTYRINRRPVPAGALMRELRAIYDGRPDRKIEVAGAPGVRYDDVVSAIDQAKSAGVDVVGIAPKQLGAAQPK